MSAPQQSSPIRGAIKTTVTTSTEILVAGQEFSIFISVQNPFEVPLVLHRVSTYLPTEFLDVDKYNRDLQAIEYRYLLQDLEEAGIKCGLNPSGLLYVKLNWLQRLLRNISRISFRILGIGIELDTRRAIHPVIARDVTETSSEASISFKTPFLNSFTQSEKKQHKVTHSEDFDSETVKANISDQISKVTQTLQNLEAPVQQSKTLQAGNSTTRVFTIRSQNAIWFKPASYRLHIEVEYEIGNVRNVDTIEHVIAVKSSLISMVLGSLLGGLAGWFTNKGGSVTMDLSQFLELCVSLVFAAMAVVLFARKKDVQPLIAIEDFWGGIAIGFLVAYTGPSIFEQIITKPTTT